MKFRVPKDDDLDSDGSDAEEPFEDHEYDETDATSELNISYNGAITKSSASIESMLLPSLQNLQLIYKSPKYMITILFKGI